MNLQKIVFLLPLVFVLSACSTSKEALLPTGDTTVYDIWNEKSGGSAKLLEARNALQFVRPIQSSFANSANNAHYTRTADNEHKNLFPRLPNPDLVMYVFPHQTQSAEPIGVPGYTTVFPFYGRIQYAMPGERTANY